MLETLTASSFEPHVGTSFQVSPEGSEPLALKLVEASATAGDPSPNREPFALVFTGPDGPALEQAIYRLEHESLGALDIFLVPLGPHKDGGLHYEAIFN